MSEPLHPLADLAAPRAWETLTDSTQRRWAGERRGTDMGITISLFGWQGACMTHAPSVVWSVCKESLRTGGVVCARGSAAIGALLFVMPAGADLGELRGHERHG